MIYHLLFWTMCAVLAAHVAVAIISIAKAYRDEGRLFVSSRRSKRDAEKGPRFLELEQQLMGESPCSIAR
jgi:hypothetical protein